MHSVVARLKLGAKVSFLGFLFPEANFLVGYFVVSDAANT